MWPAVKVLVVFKGHAGDVNQAAFSPDGERVVTASADNTARLWDVASGKDPGCVSGDMPSPEITHAAFSSRMGS